MHVYGKIYSPTLASANVYLIPFILFLCILAWIVNGATAAVRRRCGLFFRSFSLQLPEVPLRFRGILQQAPARRNHNRGNFFPKSARFHRPIRALLLRLFSTRAVGTQVLFARTAGGRRRARRWWSGRRLAAFQFALPPSSAWNGITFAAYITFRIWLPY